MSGELDVLTCGDGHAELKFDKNDPVETERARRAVTTLMKSGCILFIERDGKLVLVEAFDPKTDTYLITDVPTDTIDESTEDDDDQSADKASQGDRHATGKKKTAQKRTGKGARRSKTKVPASEAKATAVPMRSGG